MLVGTVPNTFYSLFKKGFPENWRELFDNYVNAVESSGKSLSVAVTNR